MSSISSGTTTTTGYVVSSDTTGALVLKTGASGTTAVTIGSDQSVTFVGSQTLSGGTANGVLYLNGSKVATSGSALVFDGSNLGVGTSSPASDARLTLASPTTESYVMFSRTNSGVFDVAIGNSGGSIVFRGGADSATVAGLTEFMRLDSVGNLGLGVTPSAWDSSLFKAFEIPAGSFNAYQTSQINLTQNAYFTTAPTYWAYKNTAASSLYRQTGGIHSWHNAPSGTAGNAITFTQAMTLTAAGNLGLGTTSPSGASGLTFAINGGAGQARFALKNSTTGDDAGDGFQIVLDSGGLDVSIENRENGAIRFTTNNTERARIDSSGNFLVGTTTAYSTLTVQGGIRAFSVGVLGGLIAADSAGDVARFARMTSNGSDIAWGQNIFTQPGAWAKPNNGVVSGGWVIGADTSCVYYTSGAGSATPLQNSRMVIDPSGNVIFGSASVFNSGYVCVLYDANSRTPIAVKSSTSCPNSYLIRFANNSGTDVGAIVMNSANNGVNFTSLSDYRLKENIQPMTGALAKVAALKPCTYTWKDGGVSGQGFIAHELAEVVPDAVVGEKDALNEDGSIKPQGISTSNLVATLTAAIQEQQALIESLTQRIAALEGTS